MMPPAASAFSDPPESTTKKGRQRSSSIRSLMPIIVRGFSSSSERPDQEINADNDAPASKTAAGPEEFTDIDLGPPINPTTLPKEHALPGKESDLRAPEPPPKDRDLRMLEPGLLNHGRDKQLSESHSQNSMLHQDESGLLSRPSRLWSKVRRVVQGDSKQGGGGQSRNSIYLSATGAYAGAVRSVSDTHLPTSSSSRALSSSSRDSSLNNGMPSFGSSALSLLSEDQMSSQNGPSIQANNISPSALRISVVAFETPPETAANSPTPISPTRANGKSAYQHNLPGLARRSSTKSSAVAAEVTTAESRVSQFTYSWQQARPDPGGHSRVQSIISDNADETMINSLSIHDEHFATNPSTTERLSNKSSLSQPSRIVEDADVGKASERGAVNKQQLARSKSTSDAQKRDAYHQRRHDIEKSVLGLQQQPTRATDGASPAKQRISLDQQQERCPPSPTVARNGSSSARPSITATSSSLLSPSQLLNGTNPGDTPHSPTKQDRRRSAISFGGYFANPSSEAVRKARDQREHSVTGLETDDAKGEIIHMRRTAFFERSTSPPLPSTSMLSSMLQSSLPNVLTGGAHNTNNNGAGSSSGLSRSPSKAYELAQYHQKRISTELTRPLSAITAQSVAGVGTGAGSGTTAAAEAAAAGAGATASDAKKELRKKITPLKITPLLLSGVASLPSPMFGPLSATIPRPLGSSSTAPALDRYFFGVDQVHDWNIPSYGRVKFIDHAPMVFHAIRERFHYTLADMDEALSQPMTVMRTPGKSDAIFFASHNHGRFLLKTLRGAEPENLKGFLSDYLAHIHKYPNTLLPRYLGMYTFERMSGSKALNGSAAESGPGGGGAGVGTGSVPAIDRDNGLRSKMTSGTHAKNEATATTAQHLHLNGTLLSGKDDGLPSKVVVVVLANVFDTPELVHERYDFKGSNVGRKTLATTTSKSAPRRENYTGPSVGQDQTSGMEPGRGMSLDVSSNGPSGLAWRGSRKDEQWTMQENRSWSTQFSPKREENGLGSSAPGTLGVSEDSTDDISHLTLKEMDFQNRVHAGETQLIHLGPSRRSEVLSQLEDDTALLRKHGFMDYSMMVGIRIVPKQKEQEEHSDSSSHRSQLSRGSDADNSNLDSDEEEVSSINGSIGSSVKVARKGDVGETLDKLWRSMHLSEVLNNKRIAFLKELGEKAQATFREVYSLGGNIVANDRTRVEKSVKDRHGKTRLPAVELKPVHSNRQKKDRNGSVASKASRKSKHGKNKAAFDEWFDPESFQTVRYKPRADTVARRPALDSLLDSTVMAASSSGNQKKHKRTTTGAADPQQTTSSTSRHKRPPLQQEKQPFPKDQHQPIWSQGVASEGLPDGYEVVYYFGLIDVLQKYNLVKWLERNLKGANVRLLGGGGGSSNAQHPSPLVHQPRPGTGSASFAASTLYQLLPQATASEPSLPTAGLEAMNPTLSVLLEDPGSGAASEVKAEVSGTHDRLSTSASSSSGGGGDSQSAATRGPQPASASFASSIFPSPFSSARTSQEEGTLYPAGFGTGAGTLPPSSSSLEEPGASTNIVVSSHTPSPSTASIANTTAAPGPLRSRLSSSVPFTKSIGARLSQYSQYSHSSQQSQHSHQSGRSRDSRLSFDMREMNGSESATIPQQSHQQQPQQQQQQSQQYSFGLGLLSTSPPSLLAHNKQQPDHAPPQHQQQRHFQMPQHAEVSVEEPGRYAERLVEFMREVIV
ncbi:Phosphatidylinositol 5-phosphate 4-kinase type-2 alpha [Mortierella alpina]|nr:Phosphatidylinositol 5-phosphate 4-kinase type-2 alpha [Mortierella alpina]